MSKTGSTVDETEDLAAEADETTQDLDTSPDAGEQAAPAKPSAQEGTPPASPTADEPEESDGEATPVDPVQQAIARLRKDRPAAEETAPAKPAPTSPAKDSPAKDAADATTPEPGAQAKPDQQLRTAVEGDPFGGWTPEQRKHTKGSVKKLYAEVYQKAHTAQQRLAELEPVAEIGRAWDGIVAKHKLDDCLTALDDEHIAWALQSQRAGISVVGAVRGGKQPNANDLAVVEDFILAAKEIERVLGRSAPPADLAGIAAGFAGEIPKELKDLKEVYGELDDDETKLLAAYRASKAGKGKPTSVAAPTAAPAAPATAPAERAGAPTKPAAAPAAPRWSEEELAFEAAQAQEAVAKAAGLKPEQKVEVGQFFKKELAPILHKNLVARFPGKDPGKVWTEGLNPSQRSRLITDGLAELQALRAPSTPAPTRPKPPAPLRTTGNGAPPMRGSTDSSDPVQKAISRLRSD